MTTGALGTLGSLAQHIDGRVIGDPTVSVDRLAAIDDLDERTLTFATDERYLRLALASKAAAILTDAQFVDEGAAYAKPLLVVGSVRVALADLLALLEPPRLAPGIHPTAVIEPSAQLGSDVALGAHVYVGERARIGDRTVLAAGVVIGADAIVGDDCLFHPRAVLLDRCRTGNRVVLQSGATIGSDGFGWAFVEGALRKIPQVGTVELADDVEIGVEHVHRPRADRRDVGRRGHEDRQFMSDRSQLPDREAHRHRGDDRNGRNDDHRRLRANRRSGRVQGAHHGRLARRSSPVPVTSGEMSRTE